MEQVTYQDLNPKLDNSGFHVVLCGFFNIFSVRLTTAVQNIFTVFKMLALTIIIVMGAVQIFRGKIRTTFHSHGSNYTLDCSADLRPVVLVSRASLLMNGQVRWSCVFQLNKKYLTV